MTTMPAPIGAASRSYMAVQRRLGILQRRRALDHFLLEEGRGRRALLIAPSGSYGEPLAGDGWQVTRAARPPRPSPDDARFDAVLVAHTLAALPPGEATALLAAGCAVLSPRGRLVVVEENRTSWLKRGRGPRHAVGLTRDELLSLAQDCGLARAMVFTSSCGLGTALTAARGGRLWRAWVLLLDLVASASTMWGEDNGEEVVLWAMA